MTIKGTMQINLFKIWHDDGREEKTTWEKELPTLKANYNKQEIYYILRSLLLNYTVRITNFSSLRRNRRIK